MKRILLYMKLCIWFLNRRYTIRAKSGTVLCPLMLKHFSRFRDDVLPCDVPRTRKVATGSGKACATMNTCLVRTQYPEFVSEELDCRSPYTVKISLHFNN